MKPKETLNKSGVFTILRDHQDKIKKFGVKKIGLFGSFVRNDQGSSSDIDFLVEFDKDKKNYKNFINLVFFLEDLFGRKVEIVTQEALSPYIGPHIVEEVEYAIL